VARFSPLLPDDPPMVAGYLLRARLGAGGMGRVFLAFTPAGRAIAVKVMRAELADDEEFRRRFRQEVFAARRVQGIYTAPVVDFDADAPLPWLATAYVPGPSLQEAVGENGPLPVRAVGRLVAGVAEALITIHRAGLIHRDLKPANVLLADDGPRVIDFGIARAAESTSVTRTGLRVGTPAYMAPEQVRGAAVTPETDVFALGQLAMYAATGRTAFGEGSQEALFYRIVHEQPILDGCPDSLRDLVERCLAKDPGHRPALTEIVESAQALTAGETMRPWLPPAIATSLDSFDTSTVPAPRSPHKRLVLAVCGTIMAVLLLASIVDRYSEWRDFFNGEWDGSSGAPNSSPSRSGRRPVFTDIRFAFPGQEGGCVDQGVAFDTTGPKVDAQNDSGDLNYLCRDDPTLIPRSGDRLAVVTSTPDATACVKATERRPVTELAFSHLKEGMHLCLVSSDPDLINSLTLTKKSSSYALTFTVTAWAA
jgi:serine/threonine protein kinase